MSKPRIVAVVNPQSQQGNLGRRWPEVARTLRRELGGFEELRTEAPGDATRLTRQAIESGAEQILAVGGDGTINEVVNGFFTGERPTGERTALGVVPFGTGGDFRRVIHLPREPAEVARVLANGKLRRIDVGLLDFTTAGGQPARRAFLNIASFGMSGLVDEYVNQSSKRLGGKLSFLVATVRAGMSYANQRVRLSFDDEPASAVDLTINVVAVANGQYFGGGMHIAPRAELDDGQFDVIAVGDLGMADLLRHGRRLYAGTHLGLDKVSHRRARVVRAEPLGSEPVRLDVDGETPGILPATFRILPRCLHLIIP
jgi:YegS/Rv2252/BmrU family lipid kinase